MRRKNINTIITDIHKELREIGELIEKLEVQHGSDQLCDFHCFVFSLRNHNYAVRATRNPASKPDTIYFFAPLNPPF